MASLRGLEPWMLRSASTSRSKDGNRNSAGLGITRDAFGDRADDGEISTDDLVEP
jgi:hypothetical protein